MSKTYVRPTRPVRPVDAASLLVVRYRDGRAEVLMGRRRSASSFMPGWYVFPGGRVDPADSKLAAGPRLRANVAARLGCHTRPVRADALAMAAIRETYEETGLMIAHRLSVRPPRRKISADGAALLEDFAEAGLVPACDALEYIARAITPTSSPKRFNARFFLVDASHVHGRLAGNGELLDLRWVPMDNTGGMPVADVTSFVLDTAKRALGSLAEPDRRVPLLCYVNGRVRVISD